MSLLSSGGIVFVKHGCDCKTKQPIVEVAGLKDGGIYCIELDQTLTTRAYKKLRTTLSAIVKGRNIQFIIFEVGCRLVDPPDELIKKISDELESRKKD